MAYCAKCGIKLKEGAKFCHKCGTARVTGQQVSYVDQMHWQTSKKREKIFSLAGIVLTGVIILSPAAGADQHTGTGSTSGSYISTYVNEDCTYCKGSGDCAKCDGEGYVWSSASHKKDLNCRYCNTTGDCFQCGGSGKIPRSYRDK